MIICEPPVQLSHSVPRVGEMNLEELYLDQFAFQLQMVHFSITTDKITP
jgi:hypothetical protein